MKGLFLVTAGVLLAFATAGIRSFQAVPLESVSETTANASNGDRSYSAPLADLDKDGDLDIVLSNDAPDPKLILLNDGKGRFTIGGTFGDPNWPTRNVALADLNGDGYPDIAVANRPGPIVAARSGAPSLVLFNQPAK
jgi:hypothetical protein